MKSLKIWNGNTMPNYMLSSIAKRKMLNATKYGINIQMGNANLCRNIFTAASQYTIFVGLYQNTLRFGFFNQSLEWQTSDYNLEMHPYLPLFVVQNYKKKYCGIFIDDGVTKSFYEQYKNNEEENLHFNKPELFTVKHSKQFQ